MINTDDIKSILKLVLITGNIRNIKPVSLLIVSKSGNGKTEIITSFHKKSAVFQTDISYMGLIKVLKENKVIKHLIIPDFIKITQKKRSTSDNFISILNAVTEEGIGKIDFPNYSVDLSDEKTKETRKMGLITATTKSSFAQRKNAWATFGFVQRMLIISYDYKDETIQQILESINNEEYIKDNKEKIVNIGKDIKTEKSFNAQLNKYAYKNFRNLKHLQSLAKANALIHNRKNVNQEDINEIVRLTKYMNLNYTQI